MPFTDPTTTVPGSDVTGPIERDTPDGGKIVLDTDGAIKTYNADGNITNYMGGEEGIMWNVAGWDADGTPDGEWFAFWDGNLQFGTGDPGNIDDLNQSKSGQLSVLGIGWAGALTSPGDKGGVYTDQATATFLAGKPGGQSGTVNASAFQFDSDIGVQTAAVKLTSEFDITSWRAVPEVWHVVGATGQPAYATGWAGAATSGTYQSLAYRVDAEDNLHIQGVWHATAAAPASSVFTLPTTTISPTGHPTLNWRPKTAHRVPLDTFVTSSSASAANASMVINSTGVVSVFCSSAVASGQNFGVNVKVPLGNIA